MSPGHDTAGRTGARTWAASGAMALTGWPDGAPLLPCGPVARRLDRIVDQIGELTGRKGPEVDLDWGALLSGRAALLGLVRGGRTSANGSCRILQARDGWVAINLPRPEDVASVGALVGFPVDGGQWTALADYVGQTPARRSVERARLLGMPAAVLARPDEDVRPALADSWWTAASREPIVGRRVVDLSSMWAGPLAARILQAAGAEVVKVESDKRPDGARAAPAFFDWLHPPGQRSVRLNFSTTSGVRALRTLIEGADIVIEASRPRALELLGVGPDTVADRPGRVWLSVTGHGRHEPNRNWVAFGDDAAVAGGLVAWDEHGEPVFCADAIADPVTGLLGALSILRSLDCGGGQIIDLALSRAAASLAAAPDWGVRRKSMATSQSPSGRAGPDGEVSFPVHVRPAVSGPSGHPC